VERRYTGGRADQLAQAATELVRMSPDVIVVWSPIATAAVKNATTTIPIVFLAGGSTGPGRQVGASLSRPGGNITGLTFLADSLTQELKYLELLKDLVPKLSHVALLYVEGEDDVESVPGLAQSLGIKRVSLVPLHGPEDLKGAFDRIDKEKPQGLILAPSGLLYSHRRAFIEFAMNSRLPAVYGFRELVPEGALMSLSADLSDIAARGPLYVDKILKGAKPGDLPIELPTKFALVINLKTAKALGLTIPPSLLQRADQVIE
jgi:putative ABC transport system substrate-binding protein